MAVHWIIEGSLGPSVWWWGRSTEGGEETEKKKRLFSFCIFNLFLILHLCKQIKHNWIKQPRIHHREYTAHFRSAPFTQDSRFQIVGQDLSDWKNFCSAAVNYGFLFCFPLASTPLGMATSVAWYFFTVCSLHTIKKSTVSRCCSFLVLIQYNCFDVEGKKMGHRDDSSGYLRDFLFKGKPTYKPLWQLAIQQVDAVHWYLCQYWLYWTDLYQMTVEQQRGYCFLASRTKSSSWHYSEKQRISSAQWNIKQDDGVRCVVCIGLLPEFRYQSWYREEKKKTDRRISRQAEKHLIPTSCFVVDPDLWPSCVRISPRTDTYRI